MIIFPPVKLSTFHAQALLAWKLIYKHNFSPQRYFIWNNRCILYKHKSIFLKNWFDKGIVLVSHLFNTQGYLMTYEEFLVHFNFPVTPKEFSLVFSAINSCVVSLFRDVKLVDMPIVNLTVMTGLRRVDSLAARCLMSRGRNKRAMVSRQKQEYQRQSRDVNNTRQGSRSQAQVQSSNK